MITIAIRRTSPNCLCKIFSESAYNQITTTQRYFLLQAMQHAHVASTSAFTPITSHSEVVGASVLEGRKKRRNLSGGLCCVHTLHSCVFVYFMFPINVFCTFPLLIVFLSSLFPRSAPQKRPINKPFSSPVQSRVSRPSWNEILRMGSRVPITAVLFKKCSAFRLMLTVP